MTHIYFGFWPLLVFGIATLFTPGPNNLMLMTSGVHLGIGKSWPRIWGVAFGFAFLVLCVGLGLGSMLLDHPLLARFLRYASIAYMMYLSYRTAIAPLPSSIVLIERGGGAFWSVVAFQWVNPKGWMMALAVASNYASVATYPMNALVVAFLLGLIGVASSLLWVALGRLIQHAVRTPKIFRFFSIFMACLLLVSLYPILKTG